LIIDNAFNWPVYLEYSRLGVVGGVFDKYSCSVPGPVSTTMGDWLQAGKPWYYVLCNQPLRLTQPFTLRGMVKWVDQLLG